MDSTSASFSQRRQIAIDYRGLKLLIHCQGLQEEIAARWAAFVRGHGHGVQKLPFEDDISAIFAAVPSPIKLSDELLKEVNQSRGMLNRLMQEHPSCSFHDICIKKGEVIVQGGSAAKIDIAIAEALHGQGGESLIIEQIAAQLPSAGSYVEPGHAKQMLERLAEGPLCKAVSKSAQAILQSTINAVASIKEGRAPQLAAFEQALLAPLLLKMALFCKVVVKDGGREKTLLGASAIKAQLVDLKARKETSLPALHELEQFHTFMWLLDDGEKKLVQEVTSKAVGSITTRAATSSSPVAAEGPAEQAKKKARLEDAAVMQLFG